jgi:hypothetical protein
MDSVIYVVLLGLGLFFLYGIGVFALCLHAGENLVSSAKQASNWWVAFSVSHLVGYLTITTLH